MARPVRFLLAGAAAVAVAASGGVARASACGSNGYAYAGFGATQSAFGISATVESVEAFAVLHGHVAGWVGVGGPGEGPRGTNEWLEVGLSGFPGVTGSDLYYEVALPDHYPVYHQIAGDIPAEKRVDVGVLEMQSRPNWWRVWVDGRPASRPIHLPDSYERWAPIATAESWDGGTGGTCNNFLYHFRRVRIAHAPGGGWRKFSGGLPIKGSSTRIRRSRGGDAFLAAEGDQAIGLLPSLTP
jgi:hypothetical protein